MTISKVLRDYKEDILEFENSRKSLFITTTDFPRLIRHNSPIEISIKNIQKLYKVYFGREPRTIKQVSNTSLHKVYFVTDNNNVTHVVRFNSFPRIHKEFQFFIEKQIDELFETKNIPRKNILFVDVSRKVIPTDYEISEYQYGNTLYTISLQKKIPKEFHQNAGKLLAKIHQIKRKKYGPYLLKVNKTFLTGAYESWEQFIFCNLDSHLQFCEKQNVISVKERKIIKDILTKQSFLLKKIEPVLLHGDLANHNIFVRNKEIVFIDWGDALSGDFIYDLAFFGSGAYGNQSWFDALFEGYCQNKKLPKNFWQRYWYYYLRLSLAKAVARIYHHKNREILRGRIEFGIKMASSF